MLVVANLDVPQAPPPIKDYTVTLTPAEVQLLLDNYLSGRPESLFTPTTGYLVVLQMVKQLAAAKSYRGR